MRKVSKYEGFSGPYFLVFGLNTEIYGANHVKVQVPIIDKMVLQNIVIKLELCFS